MRPERKLKNAVKFHGHLGPYLVLGLLAGELALKRLKCKKYFGLEVKAWGVDKRPKSCLVDGLQLSSGATYGKGNIRKFKGRAIKILFCVRGKKQLVLCLKDGLVKKLDALKGRGDSEAFAKKLYRQDLSKIFDLQLTS